MDVPKIDLGSLIARISLCDEFVGAAGSLQVAGNDDLVECCDVQFFVVARSLAQVIGLARVFSGQREFALRLIRSG